MCAITRTAATILAQDPLFGWTLYGGNLQDDSKSFRFIPEDGVQRCLYLISDKQRIGLSINRGHWSETVPVSISKNLHVVQATVQTGGKSVELIFERLKGKGSPTVRANGTRLQPTIDKYGRYVYQLPSNEEVKVEIRI